MAFKDLQTLTCLLILLVLNFVDVSSLVAFNEEKRLNSVGTFNKHARGMESVDFGNGDAKSAANSGRLLVYQTPNYNSEGVFRSNNRPPYDENTYQSDDAGWVNWGQVSDLDSLNTPAVERLLEMKPKVDCAGDLMKLTVHGSAAAFGSNFLIDRGSTSPLPLSQLPSKCGHTLQRTWRDFVFSMPFDGCYVSQERDMYVLPLLWLGLPVKMSCSLPTLAQSVPAVSCHTNGMIVKLSRNTFIKLKIKVMNEWLSLRKASSKCGYSLVSYPESVVIHAPYMPCTRLKDDMFTLHMATEKEFDLSCPALSLGLPMCESDCLAPTTAICQTTRPTKTPCPTTSSSTTQKLFPTPLPYDIPYQPYIRPNYSFPLFLPTVPPMVTPPKVAAVTQRPQLPVYPKPYDAKPPPVWYPWSSKPTQSSQPQYPEVLLPPTEAPKPPPPTLIHLLKPTSVPKKATPMPPPMLWPPMYPPDHMVYPLHPEIPVFVDTFSEAMPPWLYPYVPPPRPDEPPLLKPTEQYVPPKPVPTPHIPTTTKKTEPARFPFPWFKPQQNLVIPPAPTKAPRVTTVSTPRDEPLKPKSSVHPNASLDKDPPPSMQFDFTPDTNSTPAPSKTPKVVACTPPHIKAPQVHFNFSHAHCFHCPTCCPCPPSVAYHHHSHHHFGHPYPAPYLGSRRTKITAEIQSSHVESPFQPPSLTSDLFPFIQDTGYNYRPYFSEIAAPPSAMQYLGPSTNVADTPKPLTRPTLCPYVFKILSSNTASPQSAEKPVHIVPFWESTKPLSESFQNPPIAKPLAYSVQSPKPAFYQAETQENISPWGHHMPVFTAPNNVGPFSQNKHEDSSIDSMPSANDDLSKNYWYQAASYAGPMSDAPAETSLKQTSRHLPLNYKRKSLRQSITPTQPTPTRSINSPKQLNVHRLMQIPNSVPKHAPLHDPHNREPLVPIFESTAPFDSYWVPVVQPNQETVHSTRQPGGSLVGPFQFLLRHMEKFKRR